MTITNTLIAESNSTIPVITNVTLPTDGTYYEGDTLSFTFTFSRPVTVTGNPTLSLDIGGSTVTATYVSGSGSTNLVFQYTVINTVYGAAPTLASIDLASGTIKNTLGEDALFNFPSPDTNGINVDGRTITISFSYALQDIPESNGLMKTVNLNLSAPLVAPVIIPMSFLGNATYGVDYSFDETSVLVPAGVTTYPIQFNVDNDGDIEFNESFITALNRPVGRSNIFLGSNYALRVNILDSDPGKDKWSVVSTSSLHSCGITTTGILKCWGDNTYGQLGDGSGQSQPLPVEVDAGQTYKSVSVGWKHTCGITSLNKLKCWGDNTYGQLGDGSLTSQPTPQLITSSVDYKLLSLDGNTSCALTLAGQARCWGYNFAGKLGNGGTANSSTPTTVSGGFTWIDIQAGSLTTCGVTSTNVLKCWGYNAGGELGLGYTSVSSSTPLTIDSGTGYKLISGGYRGRCGLTTSDTIKCWGSNYVGMLGTNGVPLNSYSPIPVIDPGVTFKSISSSYEHVCGITSTDELKCWGYNEKGQIGDGTTTDVMLPKVIDSGTTYLSISTDQNHTCAITSSNMLKCWGSRNAGQAGDGISDRPTFVQTSDTFTDLSTGSKHTCAVSSGGKISCWGDNSLGQLGTGNLITKHLPTPVNDPLTNYLSVSSGKDKTCGITNTGVLKCWGDNTQSPTIFDPGTLYKSVRVAYGHHCGITISNVLRCWGKNDKGQLGNGTLIDSPTPIVVNHGRTYKEVALGEGHTCAISDTDQIYCWGQNTDGQLGDGTNADGLVPVLVDLGVTYKKIAAGQYHTCALTTTDILKCWGRNGLSQLGDTTMTNRNLPVVIKPGTSFKDLTTTENRTCGLTTSDELICWGGIFLNTAKTTYDTSTIYSAISAGTNHYCGLDSVSSKVKCWGDIEFTGTSLGFYTPMPVGGF